MRLGTPWRIEPRKEATATGEAGIIVDGLGGGGHDGKVTARVPIEYYVRYLEHY